MFYQDRPENHKILGEKKRFKASRRQPWPRPLTTAAVVAPPPRLLLSWPRPPRDCWCRGPAPVAAAAVAPPSRELSLSCRLFMTSSLGLSAYVIKGLPITERALPVRLHAVRRVKRRPFCPGTRDRTHHDPAGGSRTLQERGRLSRRRRGRRSNREAGCQQRGPCPECDESPS